MAELDEAAATGHVPASLLSRWEEACEDVRLWRFAPTVVHGDLSPEHILIDELQVSAVIEWASAHVGDPAQDLAPLVAQASEFAMDLFLDSYTEARGVDDEFLLARTVLASELALLRWLMHGVRSDEPEVISDAVGMLNELAELTYDSPPIAQIGMMVEPEPLPAPPPPPPPPVEAEPAAPEELFEAVDSPEQPAPVVEDIDSGELAHPVVNTEESAHTNGNSALEAEPPDRFEAGSEDDTVDFGETLLPSSPLEDDGSNPPVKSAANPDSGAIKLTEDPPGADHFFDGDDMPTIEIPRKDL